MFPWNAPGKGQGSLGMFAAEGDETNAQIVVEVPDFDDPAEYRRYMKNRKREKQARVRAYRQQKKRLSIVDDGTIAGMMKGGGGRRSNHSTPASTPPSFGDGSGFHDAPIVLDVDPSAAEAATVEMIAAEDEVVVPKMAIAYEVVTPEPMPVGTAFEFPTGGGQPEYSQASLDVHRMTDAAGGGSSGAAAAGPDPSLAATAATPTADLEPTASPVPAANDNPLQQQQVVVNDVTLGSDAEDALDRINNILGSGGDHEGLADRGPLPAPSSETSYRVAGDEASQIVRAARAASASSPATGGEDSSENTTTGNNRTSQNSEDDSSVANANNGNLANDDVFDRSGGGGGGGAGGMPFQTVQAGSMSSSGYSLSSGDVGAFDHAPVAFQDYQLGSGGLPRQRSGSLGGSPILSSAAASAATGTGAGGLGSNGHAEEGATGGEAGMRDRRMSSTPGLGAGGGLRATMLRRLPGHAGGGGAANYAPKNRQGSLRIDPTAAANSEAVEAAAAAKVATERRSRADQIRRERRQKQRAQSGDPAVMSRHMTLLQTDDGGSGSGGGGGSGGGLRRSRKGTLPIPNTVPVAVPTFDLYEGWMYKRGRTGLRSFKKRWFVLRSDGVVYYFKSQKSTTLKGTIDLGAVEEIRRSDRADRKNKFFFVIDVGWRTFLLYCKSAEAREAWQRELGGYIERELRPAA